MSGIQFNGNNNCGSGINYDTQIEEINNKINILDTEKANLTYVEDIDNRLKTVENIIASYNPDGSVDLTDVYNEINNIKTDINNINIVDQNQQTEIDELKNRATNSENNILAMQSDIEEMKLQISELENTQPEVKTALRNQINGVDTFDPEIYNFEGFDYNLDDNAKKITIKNIYKEPDIPPDVQIDGYHNYIPLNSGDTWFIDPDANTIGFFVNTWEEAINSAKDNDNIVFRKGVHTITGAMILNKNIVVTSEDPNDTIIKINGLSGSVVYALDLRLGSLYGLNIIVDLINSTFTNAFYFNYIYTDATIWNCSFIFNATDDKYQHVCNVFKKCYFYHCQFNYNIVQKHTVVSAVCYFTNCITEQLLPIDNYILTSSAIRNCNEMDFSLVAEDCFEKGDVTNSLFINRGDSEFSHIGIFGGQYAWDLPAISPAQLIGFRTRNEMNRFIDLQNDKIININEEINTLKMNYKEVLERLNKKTIL